MFPRAGGRRYAPAPVASLAEAAVQEPTAQWLPRGCSVLTATFAWMTVTVASRLMHRSGARDRRASRRRRSGFTAICSCASAATPNLPTLSRSNFLGPIRMARLSPSPQSSELCCALWRRRWLRTAACWRTKGRATALSSRGSTCSCESRSSNRHLALRSAITRSCAPPASLTHARRRCVSAASRWAAMRRCCSAIFSPTLSRHGRRTCGALTRRLPATAMPTHGAG